MFRKPLAFLLMVVVLTSIGADRASSQSAPNDQTEPVRRQVEQIISGKRTTVRVTLKDGTRKKGRIAMTRDQSFEIADNSGRLMSIDYRDVEKIEKVGSSKSIKAAIWVGVAAGIVVLVITAKRPGIGPICPLGC